MRSSILGIAAHNGSRKFWFEFHDFYAIVYEFWNLETIPGL
jgi:hypothetical protein